MTPHPRFQMTNERGRYSLIARVWSLQALPREVRDTKRQHEASRAYIAMHVHPAPGVVTNTAMRDSR